MLENKVAVIYAAGGSLAGAIARKFAAAGAALFLTGRHIESVRALADEIRTLGGKAEAAQVDALNEQQIQSHLEEVISKAGRVDISFNLIGMDAVQDICLTDMKAEDFLRPIQITMHSHFLTASAAARQMVKQKAGVILTLTATPGGIGYPMTGGFAPACCALESFSRNLASEIGAHGVRAVNIRSGGSPDSKVFADAIHQAPEIMDKALKEMKGDTMIKALPLMDDIANLASFLASDLAGKITGVTVDITAGTTAALNYKMPAA